MDEKEWEKGYDDGYDEGYAQGHREACAELDPEIKDLKDVLRQMADIIDRALG